MGREAHGLPILLNPPRAVQTEAKVARILRLAAAVLGSPILWGAAAGTAFFALIHRGALGRDFFPRYCAGHPVNYAEMYLFFVGLAILVRKALEVAAQRQRLGRIHLGPAPAGGQSPDEASPLLARLERLPGAWQDDYLTRRLREGLQYVFRRGSGDGLHEYLQQLAEAEEARFHASLGLLRLIVWAIPILGFLGTVIGITIAIANLRPSALEESMTEVTAGLGVAFDTTALALALSIVLMFVQHTVDRTCSGLLEEVSRRAEGELLGRFPEFVLGDPESAALRRLAETMVRSLEQLVRRQAELWQQALDDAQARWATMAARAGQQLQSALAGALADTIQARSRQEADSRRFEETLARLAAAIHLLNARLGEPAGSGILSLERARRTGEAA